ncbi:hypothetical protein HMPREF1531_02466 [Propionibacterium sp. oral taxon 192 str. F0372]|uniref:PHP domain-containing protein n=1 Tax=Propionibacterium sp. oral taxon 192 TaxID=671222 RepID=UPI000353BF57|nr:PHP domain-containing protein [Propionibacterium sp. oral taxon 192]EPH00358.1 hypothetical protein HMPREF1531_02466 [Propionibacterium sp. oral taxon 192 str. F0372]
MYDLHTHSVVSDGTDTPTELAEQAAELGLTGFALCDHDILDGITEARNAGERLGVRVIAGIELSAKYAGVDIHVLGYGINPTPELDKVLAGLRRGRLDRIPRMIQQMDELGVPLTLEEVMAQVSGGSVGRPHVADALVAKGIVAHRDEAFARWLAAGRPAYVPKPTVDLVQGIDLLHQAGAAVVIAHPRIRGAAKVLTDEVLADLVTEHGLDGIEAGHPMHDAATRAQLYALAELLGVIATGSSDCHGTGKIGHELGSVTTPDGVTGELLRIISARGGAV